MRSVVINIILSNASQLVSRGLLVHLMLNVVVVAAIAADRPTKRPTNMSAPNCQLGWIEEADEPDINRDPVVVVNIGANELVS